MELSAYLMSKPGTGGGPPVKPIMVKPGSGGPGGPFKPEGGPDEWAKPITTNVKGPKGPSPTAFKPEID